MIYQMGFVLNIYIDATICDNREKRNRSAKRNYERTVYEFAENGEMERFGDLLDGEMRKIRETNRNVC